MPRLVLIRHGESLWNRENRFTGWTDVGLTAYGRAQGKQAARLLRREGLEFDLCFTSVLTRAIQTLHIVLEEMDQLWLPAYKSWRLNERHYGALQGLNKAETAARHGEEQVHIWRRSYSVRPPQLEDGDDRLPEHDRRYADVEPAKLPRTESLEDTVARVLPYWHGTIAPAIRRGRRLLIAAHGNSLRGLVKYLDRIGDADITRLEIPTGVPIVYDLDDDLQPRGHRRLEAA